MNQTVIRSGVILCILLGSVMVASPAIAADDPALMPPGYVGGGSSNVAPPALAAPTPPPGPTCTVPRPIQGCDTPDVPYIPPIQVQVPKAPLLATDYVVPAAAGPAPQPHGAPAAPPPAPVGHALDYMTPVQAPATVISNGAAVLAESTSTLTLTPAAEPAANAVAVETGTSEEIINSRSSSSAAQSPTSSPESAPVTEASTVSINDGSDVWPVLVITAIGLVGVAGLAAHRIWLTLRRS